MRKRNTVHTRQFIVYSPEGGNTDLPAIQALVYAKYLLEHAQTCCPSTLLYIISRVTCSTEDLSKRPVPRGWRRGTLPSGRPPFPSRRGTDLLERVQDGDRLQVDLIEVDAQFLKQRRLIIEGLHTQYALGVQLERCACHAREPPDTLPTSQ